MLIAAFSQYFFGFAIFLSSLFLIMLVLVQRGRGGGLTGALGGAGGQSAFGTKAGDLFTRITVGVAAVWIFLCAAAVFFLKDRGLPQTGAMGDRANISATDEGSVNAITNGSGLTGGTPGSDMQLNMSPPNEPAGAGNSPIAPAPADADAPADAEVNDAGSFDLDGLGAPGSSTLPSENPRSSDDAGSPPTASEPEASEPEAGEPAATTDSP